MALQILLPLDGSPFSEQVLSFAGRLTRRPDVVLHLVQVHRLVQPFNSHTVISVPIEWERRVGEQAYLGRIAEWLREEYGCRVRTSVLHGGVVSVLNNYIRDENIGLVVMTTHGHGGLKRAWMGSVADGLVRSSLVPVVLLRPQVNGAPLQGPAELGRILIPLDGSAISEQIIEPALALGSLLNARYRLLQVIPPAPDVATLASTSDGRLPKTAGELRRLQALQYLEHLANDLRERGYEVDTAVVTHWQSSAAILKASEENTDLIAMATHGRGGWQRIALGSVTEKVQRSTTLPMLLLQPGAHSTGKNAPFAAAVGD